MFPRICSNTHNLLRYENRFRFFKYYSDYIQGQYSPTDTKCREYFYYIDHLGMLFLDDSKMKNFTSCFKDKKFLKFFFSRIQLNTHERYKNFPFLSLCGRERNFIRCDDLPIVYTHLIVLPTESGVKKTFLSYGNADSELIYPFEPKDICMVNETGRVYHPAPERMGGVGLVASKLSIQLSSNFVFQHEENKAPTHIKWDNDILELSQKAVLSLDKLENIRQFSMGLN